MSGCAVAGAGLSGARFPWLPEARDLTGWPRGIPGAAGMAWPSGSLGGQCGPCGQPLVPTGPQNPARIFFESYGSSWSPGEGRRAAGAPARERGAAPPRRPGALRVGRPGMVRRAGPAQTPQPLDRSLRRGASDAAGLAPQAGCEQVRHEQPAQARPAADGSQHRLRPPRRPDQPGPGHRTPTAPAATRTPTRARNPGQAARQVSGRKPMPINCQDQIGRPLIPSGHHPNPAGGSRPRFAAASYAVLIIRPRRAPGASVLCSANPHCCCQAGTSARRLT